MKILKRLWILWLATALVYACSSPTVDDHSAHAGDKYTCPMHPQVVQDKPGICPICKMDLVLITDKSTDAASLMLSESQMQLANVKTIKVGEGSFTSSKVLNGRLVSNPEQTEVVSSRVTGRIEKLFVKETGRKISAGDAILQLFSEQLQVLQQDYLLQLKQVAAFPGEKVYQSLRDAARNKLSLFGYSAAQIRALEKSNRVSPVLTIYASSSGVVKEINVSEGQYVSEGGPILRLENFSKLWVEADVYPSEINEVNLGSVLQISIGGLPELKLSAKVDFISPALNPSTQRLTIRASVNNANGKLQPGMQAFVLLATAEASKAVSLPLQAVIRDENGAYVWIKTGANTFTSRKVITGPEDQRQIIIKSGIKNGEEVVSSGTYLLHSEFVLKKGITL